MQGLLFVILAEENIAHSCQNSSIIGQFCKDDLIPFQCLFGSSDDLIDVCDLENCFRNGQNCLNLL